MKQIEARKLSDTKPSTFSVPNTTISSRSLSTNISENSTATFYKVDRLCSPNANTIDIEIFHLTRKKLPNLGSNSWSSLPGSYRRPGFNCESIINANCDFSPRAQLLKCTYYYAMIDSVHVTHILMLLCRCDQRQASFATLSLLLVTL